MSPHAPFKEVEASRPSFPHQPDGDAAVAFSKTVQPDWQVGGGLNSHPLATKHAASQPRTKLDPSQMAGGAIYNLMTSGIAPRPIAFVSSLSAEGVPNLAPFSYFAAVSHNPPVVMVSINRSGSGAKDTWANIRDTKEFVINIISEPFIEAANYTAIDSPASVNEWTLSGLTPRPSSTIKPPLVGESPFSMECTLEHSYILHDDGGKETGTAVFGRIRMMHVLEEAYDAENPKIKTELLAPVSRLGGISYARTTEVYELPRPRWVEEKEKKSVQNLLN